MHLNAEQIKARGGKVMGYFLAPRHTVSTEIQKMSSRTNCSWLHKVC